MKKIQFLLMSAILLSSYGWAADKPAEKPAEKAAAPKAEPKAEPKAAEENMAAKPEEDKEDKEMDVAFADNKTQAKEDKKDEKPAVGDPLEEIQAFFSALLTTIKAFQGLEKTTVDALLSGFENSLKKFLESSQPQK